MLRTVFIQSAHELGTEDNAAMIPIASRGELAVRLQHTPPYELPMCKVSMTVLLVGSLDASHTHCDGPATSSKPSLISS